MSYKLAGLLYACILFAPATAIACDDQTGSVIFEDTFPDESGGWDVFEDAKVVPPELIMSISPTYVNSSVLNTTFNATEADYCVQFKMPAAPAADNQLSAGLYFLASDYDNLFLFQGFTDGACGLYRRVKKNWTTVFTVKACGLKTEVDAPNTLRALVKGGKITTYINGTEVKAVRAQIPTEPLRFGVYTQIDKTLDKKTEVHVTRFRVTSGP